jgi:hypothetical protein
MTLNKSKIIEILDPQAGRLRESEIEHVADEAEVEVSPQSLFEARPALRRMSLLEAASTAEFPALLRDGIRSIAFDSYAGMRTTWQQFVLVEPSDKQSEDWAEENALGELPIVHEGTAYPKAKQDLDRTVNIRNYKRGMILEVTEELIRFNKTNLIKRQAAQLGRSAANTREQACYSVLNTAGNYVRNSSTNDNDIGANTSALTFSATGLNTALTTLRTMKDRKSGVYFGVMPDTLVVAPRLEMAAKQLLLSPVLQIAEGSTTVKTYGTGVTNPFRGLVNQIIVSPRFGSTYEWALLEARQAVVLQEVDGLQILQEEANQVQHEGYFLYDTVRYRGRDWFGVGMLNDRYAFYSSSSTAPTVD